MKEDNSGSSYRRWKLAIGVLMAILVGEPSGCKYVEVTHAAEGPVEKLCERYCDPVIDWVEGRIKSLRDVVTNVPRRIDPVPMKGRGFECGTTPLGEQVCCRLGYRLKIEFRGLGNPYKRNKEFLVACVDD